MSIRCRDCWLNLRVENLSEIGKGSDVERILHEDGNSFLVPAVRRDDAGQWDNGDF